MCNGHAVNTWPTPSPLGLHHQSRVDLRCYLRIQLSQRQTEAKLNLAAKQDQTSLAAVTGDKGAPKKSRGSTLLVVAPHMVRGVAMPAKAMLAEATMVEVALTSTVTHALLLPLLQKV